MPRCGWTTRTCRASTRACRSCPTARSGWPTWGSTNGTFVNGLRVDRAVLRVGDRIRIGRSVIQCVRDSVCRSKQVSDLLVTARIVLWEWDEKTGRFSLSHNFTEVTGIAAAELSCRLDHALLLVHPDDRGRVTEAIAELRAGRELAEIDVRLLRRVAGDPPTRCAPAASSASAAAPPTSPGASGPNASCAA